MRRVGNVTSDISTTDSFLTCSKGPTPECGAAAISGIGSITSSIKREEGNPVFLLIR